MKIKSREINIFSMSALDLFASGMGAFVLLAVMALPFFPNTGDSEESVAQVKKQLEQAQQEAEQAQKESEEAQKKLEQANKEKEEMSRELAKVKLPDLDIVICLDVTGSMGDQIEGLKSEITDIARVFDSLAPSVGIGVVVYGETGYDRPVTRFPIESTSNLSGLTSFINGVQIGLGRGLGGGGPEAVYQGLRAAVDMNWRTISQTRMIVIIADEEGVPSEESATFRLAEQFSSNGGQSISTVMVNNSQARSFLNDLARAGQGNFIDAVGGQSILASMILAMLAN